MLSEHIKRNTYYSFVFSSADAESVVNACLHMQLDSRCQRLLGSLLPGKAIFRQSQASWTNAMLVEIDYIAPARNLDTIQYEPHEYVPSIALKDAPQVIEQLNADIEEIKNSQKRQTNSSHTDIDKLAVKLLKLRNKNPYAPVARLFEQFGKVRFETQKDIRNLLELRLWAKFEEERIGRSNMLLMEVTDEGYKVSGCNSPRENKGRGGIAHRHFAHWIKQHFERQGRKAYLEWIVPLTNHPVDVAVESSNQWECFEICITSFDNVISNIEQCFHQPEKVKNLTLITGTQKKMRELKKLVQQDLIFVPYAGKIKFDIIENYMTRS